MKKYIRTKDGRIQIVVEPNEFDEEERRKIPNDCTMVYALNMFGCSIVKNENIIKQADTIEKLCDKFVMLNTNFGNIVVPDMEAIKFNLSKRGYVHYCNEIYGAIWTDKGLIYVAKMNEKGELELL